MQNEPVQQTQLETGIKSRQDSSSRSDRLFWGNINHFNENIMKLFRKIQNMLKEKKIIFSVGIELADENILFCEIFLN